jgi:hypothetical protein
MVGLFLAINPGQLSSGNRERDHYNCFSRIETGKFMKVLHRKVNRKERVERRFRFWKIGLLEVELLEIFVLVRVFLQRQHNSTVHSIAYGTIRSTFGQHRALGVHFGLRHGHANLSVGKSSLSVSPAGVASVGHQLRHRDGLYRPGGHMVCHHCHTIQETSSRVADR